MSMSVSVIYINPDRHCRKLVYFFTLLTFFDLHEKIQLKRVNGTGCRILEIKEMNEKKKETFRNITELNRDEEFYKAYFLAAKSEETLRKFLKSVDKEDAVRRHLVIPELLPEIISYYMDDSEYFSNDERNIFISRHNRYTPGFTHKHNFFEIVYVFAGKCTQNIGLERLHFQEGDFIFIAPGVFHNIEVFDDETVVFNILLRKATFYQMFTPLMKQNDIVSEFFSEGLYNSQHINYLIFHTDHDKAVDVPGHMIRLYQEHLFHDECSDQIMIGMMTMLIGLITRYYLSSMESSLKGNVSQAPDHFLVLNYIQTNLDTVTLADVAEYFGFSLSYCSRLIKGSTGLGFNEWKNSLRMRRAERMLLNTNKTVATISEELGYMNPETFIRSFKKFTNMTPVQYRKQVEVQKP